MTHAEPITPTESSEKPLNRYLQVGAIFSALMHLSLWGAIAHKPPPPPPQTFEVDFIPARAPAPERHPAIVSPPEEHPGEPPKTAFRSDSDNVVVKEQIKRGDDPNAGPTQGRQIGAPAEPRPEPPARENRAPPAPQRAAPPKREPATQPHLRHLALDSATILKELSPAAPSAPASDLTRDILGAPAGGASSTYRAFSRPSGSGAAILGLRGSNDYLPNLPDGDLTFLNTKASLYAVFVRRVATQVFGQLRQSGWESLSAGDINSIREYATVSATLSPLGELRSVALVGASGSRRFDELLLEAAKKGARDPHPPKGAEGSDGNIHFTFQSKSWVRLSADPRGPGFGERRWILLGTGLE